MAHSTHDRTSQVEPQALQYNREERFNYPLFKKLGDLGLLGITADEKYGGSGMDATAVVIAHEELSASDPAFCLSYLAHTLLFVNNLNFNGSHEQKLRYLPKACTGELLGGMCMSEPEAGTDVLGMKTGAKLSADGKAWTIKGNKMWITNGALNDTETGDAFLVYARTGGGMGASGRYSLFIVEKGGWTLLHCFPLPVEQRRQRLLSHHLRCRRVTHRSTPSPPITITTLVPCCRHARVQSGPAHQGQVRHAGEQHGGAGLRRRDGARRDALSWLVPTSWFEGTHGRR